MERYITQPWYTKHLSYIRRKINMQLLLHVHHTHTHTQTFTHTKKERKYICTRNNTLMPEHEWEEFNMIFEIPHKNIMIYEHRQA